jgi:ATP-binding cassette subfamily F protein uup
VKEDMRVIEYVKGIAENFPLANGSSLSASQFLNLFLFPPEQQYTYISKLSGGEKRRLHLLTVLFRNPNFLILDEPTNDLDLPTLTVLENFLLEFAGCLVIVSHDRYFMDRLVDHLFVFEGEGQISDFPGNYSQYREGQKQKEALEAEELKPTENQKTESTTVSKKKLSYKEQREFEGLEKELKLLENERKTIYEKLSSANLPFEELQQLSERINSINNIIDEKELRWLELSETAS